MRSESCGSLEEMWKKKREESMEGLKGKEEGAFRKSKKTIRLPEIKKRKGEKMIDREIEREDKEEKMDKWRKELEGTMKKVMRMGLRN